MAGAAFLLLDFYLLVFSIGTVSTQTFQLQEPPAMLEYHSDEVDYDQSNCGLCHCEANRFIQCETRDTLESVFNITTPGYQKKKFQAM